MINQIEYYFSKKIRRIFFHYISYLSFYFLLNLIVVSSVSALHFSLDHKLGTVEDWVFRHSWGIIVISKFLACFLTIRFINYLFHAGNPLIDFFRSVDFKGAKTILKLVLGLLFVYPLTLDFSWNVNWYSRLNLLIMSYWGTFFFYFLDFLIIAYTLYLYPVKLSHGHKIGLSFLWAIIFYFFNLISIDYYPKITGLMFFNFFSIFLIYFYLNRNWWNIFIYLVFYVCLQSAIWGFDPIWGGEYSFFRVSYSGFSIFSSILFLAFCLYLFYYFSRRHLTIPSK